MVRTLALAGLVAFVAGCGGDDLLGEGKPCNTSAECAPGLVCDYGQTPHACAGTLSVGRDMAVQVTDQGVEDLSMPPSDGP
jgi:hypothetical protein